jgi:hypothetical protein
MADNSINDALLDRFTATAIKLDNAKRTGQSESVIAILQSDYDSARQSINDRLSYEDQQEARNHDTSPERLKQLSYSSSEKVRFFVAGNPETPPEVLEALSKDDSRMVRTQLSDQRKTPHAAYENLAHDPDPFIRSMLLNGPYVPEDVIEMLTEDEAPEIREQAAKWIQRRQKEK